MNAWKFLTILAVGVVALFAGLGVAYAQDMDWLRIATMTVIPIAGAAAIMIVKTRSQRKSRSHEVGSVERDADERARAGAFIDTVILLAVGTAIASLTPGLPAWALVALMLAGALVAYSTRRVMKRLRD